MFDGFIAASENVSANGDSSFLKAHQNRLPNEAFLLQFSPVLTRKSFGAIVLVWEHSDSVRDPIGNSIQNHPWIPKPLLFVANRLCDQFDDISRHFWWQT